MPFRQGSIYSFANKSSVAIDTSFCSSQCLLGLSGNSIWPREHVRTCPDLRVHIPALTIRWMREWRSGESTRLQPMWPGFDFQIRRHMWIEFVGSLLCSAPRCFLWVLRSPLSPKPGIWLDLICVYCWFRFAVSTTSAPALERLDTQIKFLSFPFASQEYFQLGVKIAWRAKLQNG